jgi:hypothetical protein
MRMPGEVDHVLLTRFNLPSVGFESIIRAQDGWLKDRIELFERYCIPSVQAQTCQAFHWIAYFDPESPEWLKSRIQSHVDDKLYTPIFRSSVSLTELTEDMLNVTGGKASRLITSNLDNDDALAVDFVARLQKAAPERGRTAIYLARGVIKSKSHLYLRVDKTNAFASVADDWPPSYSCWSDWHTRLGKSMPTLELYGEPAWFQVVHGRNVNNRVRGRLTSPSKYDYLFPGLLDEIQTPNPQEYAIDTFVARPRRFARDSGRTVGKNIALRLLGKDSLDKTKVLLASLRGRCQSRRDAADSNAL